MIFMGYSLVVGLIIPRLFVVSRGGMDATVEAANLIPLSARGAVMVEVLDAEVATEPLAFHEKLEVAVGMKEASEEGTGISSLEARPATTEHPPLVGHGSIPLTALVDLLHHGGKLIAQAIPLKVILVIIEAPRKIGLDFGGGGGAHAKIIPSPFKLSSVSI
jgi:hypothetical protein